MLISIFLLGDVICSSNFLGEVVEALSETVRARGRKDRKGLAVLDQERGRLTLVMRTLDKSQPVQVGACPAFP